MSVLLSHKLVAAAVTAKLPSVRVDTRVDTEYSMHHGGIVMRVREAERYCDLMVPESDLTMSADAFGDKYAALATEAFKGQS